MSASFTLATLKTAIQDRAEDEGTALAASLNIIIQLAESRLLRELPLSIWQVRGSVQITAGTQTAPKPTGAIAFHALIYTNGSGVVQFLQPRTWAYCQDYAPNTTQDTPKYYAEDYSETEIYISPNPNVTVTATGLYTKRPLSLVDSSGGTWLSQKLGDLLLAACMSATEEYDVAPELVTMWEEKYETLYIAAVRDMAHLLPRNYTGMAAQPTAVGKLER